MAVITPIECAGLLSMWLHKKVAMDEAKQLGRKIGYSDSSLFGAAKRRMRLVGEMVMAHIALAIDAVNQRFEAEDAKAIIDPFLAAANESILVMLEKHDPDFRARYQQRMAQYFKILHESQPALGLSFAFMQNCGLNPLNNLQGQLYLVGHLGVALKTTFEMLNRLELSRGPRQQRGYDPRILQNFERTIENWPSTQAVTALRIVRSTLSGEQDDLEELMGELTVGQLNEVMRVVRAIHGEPDQGLE